jgi:acyl carrier protein
MNNILSDQDTRAVLDILVEQLGVQAAQLAPEARLQEDLGADSLTLVEITLALEERFNLSIPDEEWEKVSTVGTLFEALADLLGKPELRRA